MAKAAIVNREAKRRRLARKHESRREALRARIKDMSLSEAERRTARIQLNKMPRDSSKSRLRNRCKLSGRARGFYRKFGLSRNKLREAAMRGDIPGLVKASW